MRVGLYVRVSTQEQKNRGLSVDNQIEALRSYCKDNGYTEVSLYNDAGISASKSYKHRPELLRMLKECQEGKIDLLLFTKLDRFFRSVSDYYACVELMNNVPWRAIWEDYETETSAGVFKVNIMLSIAQAESDRTSERIKVINEHMRAKGLYVGGAPLGYLRVKNELVKDKDKEEAINAFFDELALSHSKSKAMAKAKELGVTMNVNTAHSLMTKPVYYGEIKGHKCESYITKEQYDLNQTFINIPKRENKHTYLFSGLLECKNCGSAIVSRIVLRSTNKPNYYYSCGAYRNKSGKCQYNNFNSEIHIERLLLAELDNIIDMHIENYKVLSKTDNTEKERKKLNSKLDRLKLLFEDGDIDIEEYRAKRDDIKTSLSLLQNKITAPPQPLPANWKDVYKELDKEHKKAFWSSIIYKIRIDANDKDNIEIVFR